jgi:hypothetical protein
MIKIAVHCGSAHVSGKARNYRYYVASAFTLRQCKNGSLVWFNTGNTTYPRRSRRVCEKDANELAKEYSCLGLNTEVLKTYGSLHNKKYQIPQKPPKEVKQKGLPPL